MRDKKPSLSMSDILLHLVGRVRRIESDARQVAAVLDKMVERVEASKAASFTSSKPNVPSDKLVEMLTKKKASHD